MEKHPDNCRGMILRGTMCAVMVALSCFAPSAFAQPCGGNRADIYIHAQEQLESHGTLLQYKEMSVAERIRLVSPEIELLLTAKDLPRCSFFPEYASYLSDRTSINLLDIHFMMECILGMAAGELEKGDRLRSIELAEFVVQVGCDLETPRIGASTTLIGFGIQKKALEFLSAGVEGSHGAEARSYRRQLEEVIRAKNDLKQFDGRIASAALKGDVDVLARLFREAPGSLEKRMALHALSKRMPGGKVRDLLRTAMSDNDMSVRDLANYRSEEFKPWWK
jgi:hypothetical protein